MSIKRFNDGVASFSLDDAREVLGHSIRLVDNLGDGGSLDHLCGGLWLDEDGALTVYLDLPVTRGDM